MHEASRTAVITGSTDGLGRELARAIASRGYHVVLHGRNAKRGEALAAEINATGTSTASFIEADFSSLGEVKRFAAEVLSRHRRIELLISNAGVGPGRPGARRELSRDGIELRLAVNYLASLVVTQLLEPALLAAEAGARLVHVASAGQAPIDLDDLMMERHYERELAYCRSKLAQIMGSLDAAERLRPAGVTVNAVHPATFMPTAMVAETGFATQSTIDDGLRSVLNVAFSPSLEGRTGLYFDMLRETPAHDFAYDARNRAMLRERTAGLLAGFGVEPPKRQSDKEEDATMADESGFILVSRPSPSVLLVRMNRPEKRNALNNAMVIEIGRLLDEAAADDVVRCVVLTGVEQAFSAGADIAEMRETGGKAANDAVRVKAWKSIESFPKACIAAVEGFAFGAGNELAMTCDFIVCGANAKFGQPEVNIGGIAGDGGTQRLPRRVGPGFAAYMLMSGMPIDSATALRIGHVVEVVETGRTVDRAVEIARIIASRAPLGVQASKQCIRMAGDGTIEAGIAFERAMLWRILQTDDAEEGGRAFLQKRPPAFSGRW